MPGVMQMTTSKTEAAKERATNKTVNRGKPAARRGVAKAKPAATKASVQSTKLSAPRRITAEKRLKLIREAAFLRAEKRGFRDGSPVEDWLQAEKEVDKAIRK